MPNNETPVVPTEEKKEDVTPTVVEPTAVTEEPSEIEAALAQEKERGKPDPEKAKAAYKQRQKDDDDEPTLKLKDLDEVTRKIEHNLRTEMYADRVTEIAASISSSEKEAELIKEIHKNRIWPEGMSLQQQMEEAHAIANRGAFQSKLFEAARSMKSRELASKTSTSAVHDSPLADEPKVSSSEAQALKDAGMSWDAQRRAYKKPLAGGKKTYYFDPKSRKRWTE